MEIDYLNSDATIKDGGKEAEDKAYQSFISRLECLVNENMITTIEKDELIAILDQSDKFLIDCFEEIQMLCNS